MRTFLALACVLLLPASVAAQTNRPAFMLGPYAFDAALLPVAAEQTVPILEQHIDIIVADTLQKENATAKLVTIDGVPAVLARASCAQFGADVKCRLTLATPMSAGSHQVVVTRIINSIATETPFTVDTTTAPKPATSPRVVITVTLP
jgi:hypothetical protein